MTLKLRPVPLLLSLGVALLPVYVFKSGNVQPAHMVMACFAALVLLQRGVPVTSWSLLILAVFFHSFMVEGVYAMVGGDPAMMIHSIFFLYNFLISCAVYLYCRQHGLSALVPGLLIACVLAAGTVIASGVDLREMGEGGRSTGTFNNPNQLGYFSVCLLSLTYLLYRHGLLRYAVAAGMFAIALFLAISSLSKAAMIANFMVIPLALKPSFSRNSLALWGLGAAGMAVALLVLHQRGAFDEYLFMQRLVNMASEDDSSLASRGYFALLQGNILQILFGLGNEGVHDIVDHEVHSTFGSVLNNYGLVGFILFSSAFVVWSLRLWQAYGLVGLFCLAGPAMLYGITHNGLRFTIFWLLFAATMAMAQRMRADRSAHQVHAARRRVRLQRLPGRAT